MPESSQFRHAHPLSPRTRQIRALGYLRVTEAARMVGVARLTVYRWLRAGRIRGLLDHGAYYVDWLSLVHQVGLDPRSLPADVGTREGPLPDGTCETGPVESPSPVADAPQEI